MLLTKVNTKRLQKACTRQMFTARRAQQVLQSLFSESSADNRSDSETEALANAVVFSVI